MIFELPMLDTYPLPTHTHSHFFKILSADFYIFMQSADHFNTSDYYTKLYQVTVGRKINYRTIQRSVLTLLTS